MRYGQVVTTVAAQAASSATNFLLLWQLGRVSSVSAFGIVSGCVALQQFVIGGFRAFIGESSLLRGHVLDARREQSECLSMGLLGLIAVPPLSLFAFSAGDSRHAVLLLAAITPIVVLQDLLRYAWFHEQRPAIACASDGVWFVAQVTLLLAFARDGLDAVEVVGAWSTGSALAALAAWLPARGVPSIAAGLEWWRGRGSIGVLTLREHIIGAGSLQIGLLGVLGLAGSADLGLMRQAELPLAFVNVVTIAASAFGTARVRRLAPNPGVASQRFALGLGVTLGFAAAMVGVTLAIVPDGVLTYIFGPEWKPGGWLLAVLVLNRVVMGLSVGGLVYARGHELFPITSRARTIAGVGTALGLPLGAAMGGALTAGIAFAISNVIALRWWMRPLLVAPSRSVTVSHNSS